MKSDDAVSHFSWLEPVRGDLLRLKIIWILCCLSPLVYLTFSRFVVTEWFTAAGSQGFYHLAPESYRTLLVVLGVVVLGLEGLLLYVRHHFSVQMGSRSARSAAQLLQIYLKRTIFLAAISEIATFLGFVLYLFNGELSSVFLFGMAGLIFYAQSYPSQRGLVAFAKRG